MRKLTLTFETKVSEKVAKQIVESNGINDSDIHKKIYILDGKQKRWLKFVGGELERKTDGRTSV